MTPNSNALQDKNHALEPQKDKSDRQISIFDESNPASIASMLPNGKFKDVFLQVNEELLFMEAEELRVKIRPSALVNSLRKYFWIEYDMALKVSRKIDLRRMYGGLCTTDHFLKMVCKPNNVAWILTPIPSYEISVEEVLDTTFSMIRKAISSAIVLNPDGTLNLNTANFLLKVFDRMDQRKHGSIVQRLETKSYTITKDISEPKKIIGSDSEIDTRILELERGLSNPLDIALIPSATPELDDDE